MTWRCMYSAFLLLCAWLCSCDYGTPSDPFDMSEVPGRYYANFGDNAEEYFELRADRTYTYFIRCKAGEEYSIESTWRLSRRPGTGPGGFWEIRVDDWRTNQRLMRESTWPDSLYTLPCGVYAGEAPGQYFTYKKLSGRYYIAWHLPNGIYWMKDTANR